MDAFEAHRGDRRARVNIDARGFSCAGLVHLNGLRLSDVMNEKNRFLVVIDAEVLYKTNGGSQPAAAHYDTIFINKAEIQCVVPAEQKQGLAGM